MMAAQAVRASAVYATLELDRVIQALGPSYPPRKADCVPALVRHRTEF
jgi:hypothetical protein